MTERPIFAKSANVGHPRCLGISTLLVVMDRVESTPAVDGYGYCGAPGFATNFGDAAASAKWAAVR
jgi:hypothetical protein